MDGEHEVIAFSNFASIVAAEKHYLSYHKPQFVHRPCYCGVQTLPLQMHSGGEKFGINRRSSGWIPTHNELDLTFGLRSTISK